MRSGWLTTAGEARAFEQEFATAVGSRHAIAVNSATAGLHLAVEAAGVRAGDRVVMSPYTFTSTAEVVRYLGADPLFVDIREDDLNIDPDLVATTVEAASQESGGRLSAIMPVHIGGHPCAMDRIGEVAEQYGLAVVEDAAHALPGTLGGRALGTIGTAGVYSFYATKTITTGEGGMVVTNDAALAKRMSVMRLHGIDREVWDRYTSTKPSWQYDVVDAGYKYNMPDILAAIGRVQLRRAEEFRQRRAEIASVYTRHLGDLDYLTCPPDSAESSWHLYVIRLDPERLSIDRDGFVAQLAELGVASSVHYIPLHHMRYYRERYGLKPDDFPVSSRAYMRALSLPIYPGLTDEQVDRVIGAVRSIGDSRYRPR
jgi:dTDP-4-amino-4,6-dideoxygalactose transaminase